MAEKEAEKEIERIYVIPLRKAKIGRSSLAAPRAETCSQFSYKTYEG